MEQAYTFAPANLAVQFISVSIMVIVPFIAGAIAHRRLGVGWRIFWMGAIAFVVSQMLLRIPLIGALQLVLSPQIAGSPMLSFAAGIMLAFTAALFETGGRYAGYQLLLRRDPKSWNTGVMFGLGHGGIESAVLIAGVALMQLMTLLTLTSAGLAAMPPAQANALTTLAETVSAGPAWMGLAGAWERIIGMAFHVGMSVLVLQTFVRGEWRWLGYALSAHFLMDFITPTLIPALLPPGTARGIVTQLVLLLGGAFGVWVTLALRPRNASIHEVGHTPKVLA